MPLYKNGQNNKVVRIPEGSFLGSFGLGLEQYKLKNGLGQRDQCQARPEIPQTTSRAQMGLGKLRYTSSWAWS